MDRNIQRNGLVNLLVLLGVGASGFIVARYANSLAGQVTAAYVGVGVLVAFVSWFQMRLEEHERIEKLELEEMARSKGSAALFESKDAEIFPAQRSREQFERFFVPIFTAGLFILEALAVFFLWRWLSKADTGVAADRTMVALSLFGLFALVLFLLGRFSATIARLEDHRLLRPGANYLLLGAYLCFLTALGIAGVKAEFPKTDFYVARVLCGVLGLIALETLVTLILEIYRPRVKGKVVRPLYESRLVGLLGQPEGLITTAAQALDYQFGFKVSETWFYRFFEKALAWLILLQLGVLLLSTCFIFVESGEQVLLERFGRPIASRGVLGPGAHLKLPWPLDKTYRYRTEQIQVLNVGFTPGEESEHERTILWTGGAHTKEENFLVASREQAATEGAPTGSRRAPPVSLLAGGIPVQFQIRDLTAWAYNHEDSSNLLQQVATREVVRYLASVDLNEIMSRTRFEAAQALRDRIQAAADGYKLGANILFVGLQDVHPPSKVAPDYEKVVGAIHQRQAKVLAAQADAIRTNALATAQAFAITNNAEVERIRLQVAAVSRAAAFTNQIPAFDAAPSVYMQRAYFRTFARATAKTRKYVLLTTNTDDVIVFDLQDKIGEDMFRLTVPPPKPSNVMKRNLLTLIVGVVLIVIFALWLLMFQVRQSEVAVVTTFGNPTRPLTQPGPYFKWPPPIQRVYKFDQRTQNFEDKFTETLTADNNNLLTTVYVGWRITDAKVFFPKFKGGSINEAERKLEDIVTQAKAAVVGKHPLSDFVNADEKELKFDAIENEIKAQAQSQIQANNWGVSIEYLGIKKLGLPESVTQNVFERMTSERQTLISDAQNRGEAEAQIIRSTANRKAAELMVNAEGQATLIRGQGEAAAAEFLPVFEKNPALANFDLRLKALEDSLKERATLIFDQRTPPFDLFQGFSTNAPGKR